MRLLGLSPRMNKLSKTKTTVSSVLPTPRQRSALAIDDIQDFDSEDKVVIKNDETMNTNDFDRIESLDSLNSKFKNRRNSFAGFRNRSNSIAISSPKRKFSLDSSNLTSFIKPLTRTNIVIIDNSNEENKSEIFAMTNQNESNNESVYSGMCSPVKEECELIQKPQTNQSARTYSSLNRLSNSFRCGQSARTNFSNISNITSNSLRKASLLNNNQKINFPKIRRSSSNRVNNANINKQDEPNKRQVSFGRIELTQLEIPTMYKYSNIGYEKFKLNPHFYLPDGTLKRKFSLPKLDETLEAVKNCRYLRKNSLEEAENVDVKNIFRDIEPSQMDLRNFDIISDDD